jgi:hypothetical protein
MGVPESFALGLTIAERAISITLLVGILVGNVVEAYGSAQPILVGGRSKRLAVGLLGAIGLVLAGSTVVGATVLADAGGSFVGTAQAAAAGAVLAVVTVAIVRHVFAEVNRLVAVASAIGFVVWLPAGVTENPYGPQPRRGLTLKGRQTKEERDVRIAV